MREHGRIRSADACYKSSSMAVGLAKQYGAKLHVLHLTTAKELEFFTPGPVEIPARILRALAQEPPHHRTDTFRAVMGRVTEGLRRLHGTAGEVFLLAASGTGAMEAAVVNLLAPGERALAIAGGKFGERWASLLKAYGIAHEVIEVEWGRPDGGASPGRTAVYPLDVVVEAADRPGLLRDISEVFAKEKINVTGVHTQSAKDGSTAWMTLPLDPLKSRYSASGTFWERTGVARRRARVSGAMWRGFMVRII